MKKTIRNLEKNRMKAYHITSKEQLFNTLNELVRDGEKVCFGGSCTLEETGVLDYLKNRNIELKIEMYPDLHQSRYKVLWQKPLLQIPILQVRMP